MWSILLLERFCLRSIQVRLSPFTAVPSYNHESSDSEKRAIDWEELGVITVY
jgi:hypothetical protein